MNKIVIQEDWLRSLKPQMDIPTEYGSIIIETKEICEARPIDNSGVSVCRFGGTTFILTSPGSECTTRPSYIAPISSCATQDYNSLNYRNNSSYQKKLTLLISRMDKSDDNACSMVEESYSFEAQEPCKKLKLGKFDRNVSSDVKSDNKDPSGTWGSTEDKNENGTKKEDAVEAGLGMEEDKEKEFEIDMEVDSDNVIEGAKNVLSESCVEVKEIEEVEDEENGESPQVVLAEEKSSEISKEVVREADHASLEELVRNKSNSLSVKEERKDEEKETSKIIQEKLAEEEISSITLPDKEKGSDSEQESSESSKDNVDIKPRAKLETRYGVNKNKPLKYHTNIPRRKL